LARASIVTDASAPQEGSPQKANTSSATDYRNTAVNVVVDKHRDGKHLPTSSEDTRLYSGLPLRTFKMMRREFIHPERLSQNGETRERKRLHSIQTGIIRIPAPACGGPDGLYFFFVCLSLAPGPPCEPCATPRDTPSWLGLLSPLLAQGGRRPKPPGSAVVTRLWPSHRGWVTACYVAA